MGEFLNPCSECSNTVVEGSCNELKRGYKADTEMEEDIIKAICLVNLTFSNLKIEWSKGFRVSF